MHTNDLVLRCFADRRGGQWQAFCLDLCLAAQGETFEDARSRLEAMICSYVADATVGPDHRAFGADLLRRRAPWQDWLRYYAYALGVRLTRRMSALAFREALPMQPGKCHAC